MGKPTTPASRTAPVLYGVGSPARQRAKRTGNPIITDGRPRPCRHLCATWRRAGDADLAAWELRKLVPPGTAEARLEIGGHVAVEPLGPTWCQNPRFSAELVAYTRDARLNLP